MCGLAGVLNNEFPVEAGQLAAICRKVSFRGPDSSRQRLYDKGLHPADRGNTAVFFNRLAIIDLDARSNQPFEDDRYTLVFNGEIYNYRSLKDELKAQGFSFRTTSDTEVLFYALQRWGADALKRINGMFAFCWLDRTERRFILSRDRVGIKPLYYRQHGKSLIFSSELDSVLRLSPDRPGIQPAAIHQFLQTQFIPTPFTIIRGVFKLPPGHYLQGSWDQLEQAKPLAPQAYWDAYDQAIIPPDPGSRSDPADLERILVDTLSRQMVADVPLGLFLSSGVDSSLLTALVNKHFAASGDVNLFTVAFTEDTVSDESRDAGEFIKGFNNPHLHPHRLVIDPSVIGGHLDRMYDYFDEPFGDQTSLLNWVISIKAKEFVTVALSGDGADELFWGYGRYGQWRDASLTLPGNRSVSRQMGSFLRPFLPSGYWRSSAALQLEKDPVKRHFNLFASPVMTQLEEKAVWQYPIWALAGIDRIRHRDDLVSLLDVKTYLADAMLHKVDRASMAASLEVRVPYLDNTVIDYSLSLPLSEKSDAVYRHKAILKKLLTRLAPHYPVDRPKKGFNFPLDSWLRNHWCDKTRQLIDKDTLTALGLEAKPYLDIVKRYYAGDKNNCIPVWYLLNLALWYRKYKDIIPQQPA
ncbi:MAG TPA: asparagine synthase (glutamine-hydrolyzing) [Puia sp.]|uniref:asparagine synthase (glutamine-hydrolyzing) n=1 Tax=Puia sp. TaxID=2045100 RepID=UPI002B8EE41C|nr:asparagine synthase (glutamine-hydrolyzing) [Puia sp.]HVU99204.1 asparagine synthase (glutamine-hydrolyzing) [Puia sp.]